MREDIVTVQNLMRRFGERDALSNVSLSVPRGIVFGLVGENGAGKTTLIKHLLGLFKAQEGSVRVFGWDPVRRPVEVLSRIGYLSENRDLPDWMRIDELLRYQQAFYPSWDEKFAAEMLERFELTARQPIKSLSRGQRARVGLLVALAYRPDLLVLDEPSSGLDPIVRRDILAAIIRTVADEGRTVLFSSHLLDEVERVADEVALLHQGKVVLAGSLSKLLDEHRRVTLRFAEPQPAPPLLPGAIRCHGAGREWDCLCNGGIDSLKREAIRLGAEVVGESAVSLDEVFIGRIGRNPAHVQAGTTEASDE
ncbi:MAG TPA: ABC transporter ATP-binding protein [Pirellulales bacterium]|nr:ABC transporter ATP-binding protein [Pirellulales bacterium]